MSTLRVGTFANAAGSQSTSAENLINGSAKAWVNFNGSGVVAIRAAYNVTSITDNAVGDYTVNFTTAMPDGNYSAAGNCSAFGASRQDSRIAFPLSTGPFNAASCQVLASYGGAAAFDPTTVTLSIFR